MNIKKLVKLGIYFAISCILCVIIYELTLRAYGSYVTQNKVPFTYDECMSSKKYLPNSATPLLDENNMPYLNNINSFGFRGDDLDMGLNQTNIFFMGDSIIYGTGVAPDDTFLELLEDKLNNGSNEVFSARNFGSPDLNLVTEIKVYDCYIKQYKPKYVILLFNEFANMNNIQDAVSISNQTIDDKNILFNKIRFYVTPNLRVVLRIYFNIIMPARIKLGLFEDIDDRKTPQNEVDFAIEKNKEYLLKIKELSEKDGFKLLIIYDPHPYHTMNESYSTNLNYSQVRLNLTSFLKENNFTFVDLYSMYKEETEYSKLLLDKIHFNKHAHRRVSDITYEPLLTILQENTNEVDAR